MAKEPSRNGAFLAVALLHLVCCGLPSLVVSGVLVSPTAVADAWRRARYPRSGRVHLVSATGMRDVPRNEGYFLGPSCDVPRSGHNKNERSSKRV